MYFREHRRVMGFIMGILFMMTSFTSCVNQYQGEEKVNTKENGIDSEEKVVIATSMATVEICEKLGITLAGVPSSTITELPECYVDLPTIGTAMAPDMEIIATMNPDWVLSPVSLQSNLGPKYQAIKTEYAFLNLNSVPNMYKSIMELGKVFGKEDKANKLLEEFTTFYEEFQKTTKSFEKPTVLILMGLPGSYVVATGKSYVGSLVRMAGGSNVYEEEKEDFLKISTEDMLKKDPDIILRTSHAMPDEVMEMFAEEFKSNDIWQHFNAVKNDRVFDLSHSKFGMSATFSYKEALKELQKVFYGGKNET